MYFDQTRGKRRLLALDAAGNPVPGSDAPDYVLKPGESFRVPAMLHDGAPAATHGSFVNDQAEVKRFADGSGLMTVAGRSQYVDASGFPSKTLTNEQRMHQAMQGRGAGDRKAVFDEMVNDRAEVIAALDERNRFYADAWQQPTAAMQMDDWNAPRR